jgi:acetoin utilization deacetylase AcuC-like enzyme
MLLIHDDRMQAHDAGRGHPESPARLGAVVAALRTVEGARWLAARPATRLELERAHDASYVDAIDAVRGRRARLDPDTAVSPGSVEAAYLAAGAAVQAVEAVVGGPERHAFALVRPPGHHAEAHAAMGFCLFNNVAVAAAHAIEALGCERVLVLDWDVHHGNGTQHSFWSRRDVLYASLHQFPFYPGTGALEEVGRGAGEGYTVNLPLPAGMGDGDYATALSDVVVPIADAFRPEIVLVSAGFDAHRRDPLANMLLTEEGYAAMAGLVHEIAKAHAGGRVVLVLEGGYDLEALAASARACVQIFLGATPPASRAPSGFGGRLVADLARQHRRYWRL